MKTKEFNLEEVKANRIIEEAIEMLYEAARNARETNRAEFHRIESKIAALEEVLEGKFKSIYE